MLRRVVVQYDGLLVCPLLGPQRLVPWKTIKGVRIAPADQWSGRAAAPGSRGWYTVQVRLDGEWQQVGDAVRIRHSWMPREIREALYGDALVQTADERYLRANYELMHERWTAAGGTPGDEDDNWPRF